MLAGVEADNKLAGVEADSKLVVEAENELAGFEAGGKLARVEADHKFAEVEADNKLAEVEAVRFSSLRAASGEPSSAFIEPATAQLVPSAPRIPRVSGSSSASSLQWDDADLCKRMGWMCVREWNCSHDGRPVHDASLVCQPSRWLLTHSGICRPMPVKVRSPQAGIDLVRANASQVPFVLCDVRCGATVTMARRCL